MATNADEQYERRLADDQQRASALLDKAQREITGPPRHNFGA
jgi:hypothetical protein